jgi:RsiW-degrading membrane proteinase PrsW (M82 family)
VTLAPTLPRSLAQRALQTLSWAGLAFSLAVLIVSAPHLLEIGGGAGLVLGNVAQFAWTLALLLLVFRRRRTVGARALAGAALAGFFGVASLAVLAGKPLVDRLGNDSDFVTLLFAPVSEEVIKLLPAALFLLLATRSRRWRPSACDAVLLGFTAAAGFAVYENILFARGTSGGWFATLPLSLVLPTIATRGPMLAGGHAVYTGLATLGLAVAVIYYVRVDAYLRTSAPHIFAAGDVTGRMMLAPQAVHDGFVAATNAVRGATVMLREQVCPIGSFTEPEYAQVGLTEAKAREAHDVVVAVVRFNETTRTIIDGRTVGFCKLIADRATCAILGCHVVGERAVEIVQVASIAIAARMRVDDLARVPLSFPTYAGILGRAAYRAAEQLNLEVRSDAAQAEQ